LSRNSLAELPKIKHFGCGLALPLLKFTTLMIISPEKCHDWVAQIGEGLDLLGIWRGASFAVIHQTGFGEPSKGAPHGSEITCFASDP
jgi:hypothetical protein